MQTIFLASGSPRRKELLEQAGVRFTVKTIDTDEATSLTDPKEVVLELSRRKAAAVKEALSCEKEYQDQPLAILGADTLVAYQGEILGKPKDPEDALRMLTLLSGDTHQVYTGVALYYQKKAQGDFELLHFVEETSVTSYPLTREVLERYIATGESMDKAGAYGIQGLYGLFVKGIDGDIQNVIGLPVPRLLFEASKAGLLLSPWQCSPGQASPKAGEREATEGGER